jgi:hypothetical protein
VTEQVTLAEAEDRIRRTLARRAGDVAPMDDPVPLPAPRDDLSLIPAAATPGRRPRLRYVAAAAAACVVVATAVGLAAGDGGDHAEIGPAQEGPATTATTAPPGGWWDPDLGPVVPVGPEQRPRAVAEWVPAGQEPNQEIWLYATFYPDADMAAQPASGDTREAVAGAEVTANLDTAGWYPAITVWLYYADGVLGLHGGMVSHDEMVAMAQSVQRTPWSDDFTMTPPPGWERR